MKTEVLNSSIEILKNEKSHFEKSVRKMHEIEIPMYESRIIEV
jgi:hypothetical protein